ADAVAPIPTGAAPGPAQVVKLRILRHWDTVRSVRRRRVTRAALAARARFDFLNRAPRGVVQFVAGRLGQVESLALDPDWHFRVPEDDEGQLTILNRDIWDHSRENGIETPIVFRWYDGLRVQLSLGNDLSLCLYGLGAFEPNEFVFLRSVLEPGM